MSLQISGVVRIDYPNERDRVENEPIGIFLQFADGGQSGPRISANEMGTVEFSFESFESCTDFVDGIYGTIVEPDEVSELMRLKGETIAGVFFGLTDAKRVESHSFSTGFGYRIAVQPSCIFLGFDILEFHGRRRI